jgi:protein-tyrosine phosphatase
MTKVLMVCLGNICRSPLAEGILKSKLKNTSIKVESAGTAGYHIGEKPDSRSIAVAIKNGIDISNQKGRQFKLEDFDEFDFIYVMDKSNYKNVIKLARNASDIEKVNLILAEIDQSEDVPDPYYGGNNGFEAVFSMLDRACEVIANKLKN